MFNIITTYIEFFYLLCNLCYRDRQTIKIYILYQKTHVDKNKDRKTQKLLHF